MARPEPWTVEHQVGAAPIDRTAWVELYARALVQMRTAERPKGGPDGET
jgi:hypothetical protein